MSDQSEAEEEIQQRHSASEVNHEVVHSNQQHHDDGAIDHDIDDSTKQQPLSCDCEKDNDGQEANMLMVIYHLVVWMVFH